MLESIGRCDRLSVGQFTRRYLLRNVPAIVTDAMNRWPARSQWTPGFLKERFGALQVVLQNEVFDTTITTRLGDYIDGLVAPATQEQMQSSLKYSRTESGDFSRIVYNALRDDWSTPYFLPKYGYLHPPCWRFDAVSRKYPPLGFGLFLSPRGAVTRLHCDAYCSDAVLCQIYGRKDCRLFPPATVFHPRSEPPDTSNFPADTAECWHATLVAGEVLFIPHRWYHEVTSLETSISLTFNFVHAFSLPHWLRWLVGRGPWQSQFPSAPQF